MLFSGVGKFSGMVPSFCAIFTYGLSDFVVDAACRVQSLRLLTAQLCLRLRNAKQVRAQLVENFLAFLELFPSMNIGGGQTAV